MFVVVYIDNFYKYGVEIRGRLERCKLKYIVNYLYLFFFVVFWEILKLIYFLYLKLFK